MERAPRGFDPTTPNVARLYDYFLGGKDHLAVDRAAAEEILRTAPETRGAARANRAFVLRAVRELAAAGVRQFVDIGAGLPAPTNVHDVARQVAPGARVAYVDHDPVVLTHVRALPADDDLTAVVEGDLRDPGGILKHPDLLRVIDFAEPVGIVLGAVLHFVGDADDPAHIVATLRRAMAPGSHLVLSHVTGDARPATVEAAAEVYGRAGVPLHPRGRERIAELLAGFEPAEPGLVWLPQWRPEEADVIDFAADPTASLALGGVGRKV
ncbi:SAM-dependent methyltransferase [Nonomuraea muscovyensis]|uniref:SAM-dependent methyltransferase n=1 Tax=Nonomuraea muscovyensis TaxID=1124761 RepID=A0A7X0C9J8_9ACTN|nr:SAM-dependent methyltransferase [Nonomuraea muscovyensis]MBB6351057.1 SAM-dependent methyltransferase [Nonomuraea muscovyensis]MDF2705812.1 SAM-dependent methyltransferase [Nonomuraea muscovyensis]